MFIGNTAMYTTFFAVIFVMPPNINFDAFAFLIVLAAASSIWFRPAPKASAEEEVAALPATAFVLCPFAANTALAEFNLLFHAAPPYTE